MDYEGLYPLEGSLVSLNLFRNESDFSCCVDTESY